MNQQLLIIQSKVNDIIYNPFVNLKDQINATKSFLLKQNIFTNELARLDASLEELEQLEELPHGKLERIKGFNKIKTRVLKLIKEVIDKLD